MRNERLVFLESGVRSSGIYQYYVNSHLADPYSIYILKTEAK